MNIYTSYFGNMRNIPAGIVPIAICAKAPAAYTGRQYKTLAPKYDCLMQYKQNHNEEEYVQKYNSQVLSRLSPAEVVRQLELLSGGKDVVMLCYEKRGDFCHRHLVAQWLNNHGYNVKEL